jgi:AAA+ ATPase superfamily predicted ATPase
MTWNKIQKGINEAARKIIQKEERPHRICCFDEECLGDKKKACNTMIKRSTRQNKQEHNDKKDAHKLYRQKRILFKSQSEQREIACNNNEAKKCYEEMSIIRKIQTTNITN